MASTSSKKPRVFIPDDIQALLDGEILTKEEAEEPTSDLDSVTVSQQPPKKSAGFNRARSDFSQIAEKTYDAIKNNGGTIPATTFTDEFGRSVSISPTFVEIPFSELENKTQISDLNPRLWVESEYNDLALREQIAAFGIRNMAAGYRIDGDDTIYIANGGTRRSIAISLFNDKGINTIYPLLCYQITAEDMWIVRQLVDDSEYGRKFNTIENSLRLRSVFKAQVSPTLSELARLFQQATGNTFSRAYCKELLVFSLLLPSISSRFLKHFARSEDVTAKIMKLVFQFATGRKLSDLDITDLNNSAQFCIRQDLQQFIESLVTTERLQALDELLATADKKRVKITKLLTQELAKREQSSSDNSMLVEDAKPSAQEPTQEQATRTQIGFSLAYSREDYAPEEMETIKAILARHEAELKEIQERIEREVAEALSRS